MPQSSSPTCTAIGACWDRHAPLCGTMECSYHSLKFPMPAVEFHSRDPAPSPVGHASTPASSLVCAVSGTCWGRCNPWLWYRRDANATASSDSVLVHQHKPPVGLAGDDVPCCGVPLNADATASGARCCVPQQDFLG